MHTTFSILFFILKNRATPDRKAPIYCRITVDGKRAQMSIQRKTLISKWDNSTGLIKGTSAEAKFINKYINEIRYKLNKIQERFLDEGRTVTAMAIKNRYLGIDKTNKMLIKIFDEHNEKVENLVGKDFASSTLERYKTTRKHIFEYLLKNYKSDDIPVKEIDHKFIIGFEYYLKTIRKCSHNTAVKYITNFKKIIRIAYAHDWINKDPFLNWKGKLKIVNREFLSQEEIEKIASKEINIDRLDLVRDIFLFSCFTGLAYADVKKLKESDIVIGIDSKRWIKTKRIKTETHSNIPLLEIPEYIIAKYARHPNIVNSNKVIPILSNQKMNSYLKEIADACNISKNLTFHLARHTFATTVTLTNGVSIESVSKMLGHKSLRTTQHYAKILDKKVSDDMQAIRRKFSNLHKTENTKKLTN